MYSSQKDPKTASTLKLSDEAAKQLSQKLQGMQRVKDDRERNEDANFQRAINEAIIKWGKAMKGRQQAKEKSERLEHFFTQGGSLADYIKLAGAPSICLRNCVKYVSKNNTGCYQRPLTVTAHGEPVFQPDATGKSRVYLSCTLQDAHSPAFPVRYTRRISTRNSPKVMQAFLIDKEVITLWDDNQVGIADGETHEKFAHISHSSPVNSVELTSKYLTSYLKDGKTAAIWDLAQIRNPLSSNQMLMLSTLHRIKNSTIRRPTLIEFGTCFNPTLPEPLTCFERDTQTWIEDEFLDQSATDQTGCAIS